MSDEDDERRALLINVIGQAAHKAGADALERLMESEGITPEDASSIFGTSLLWPAISYLIRIGVTKAELLEVASAMYDEVQESEAEEQKTPLLN